MYNSKAAFKVDSIMYCFFSCVIRGKVVNLQYDKRR